MLKKLTKKILTKISRFIFLIIPEEFKARGNKVLFGKLKSKLQSDLIEETLTTFKADFKKSVLFNTTKEIREYAIKTSVLNDKNKEFYYLEFGVFEGTSANYFSKYVKQLYAFDSFEGLKEDWFGTQKKKGYFNLNKKIPKLESNVEPIVGWVEDTLDDFLKKHNPKINFVHLDMDTYSPTKFTLEKLKPYLVKNSIILFDEFYLYYGWENGEYKALKEVFKDDEFEYKAFNLEGAQCAIQLK